MSRIEPNDARIDFLHTVGMPFITHGRTNMGVDHAFFDFDNTSFGRDAVSLLASLGRSRVGLVTAPQNLSYANFTLEGYEAALADTGVQGAPITLISSDDPLEKIAARVHEVFSAPNRPDSVICGNVGSTVGVVNGVERAGLVVGKDVDVVSKQSTANFLKWYGRPLYSIKEDFKAAGFGLANSLVEVIGGASVLDHQTLAYPEQWGDKVTDLAILPQHNAALD